MAGGAPLDADGVVAQILHGDAGALLGDDGLGDGGIAVSEVHDQLPVLGDGDAGDHGVHLALLGGQKGAVKVHGLNIQLQTDLLADQLHDLRLDAHHRAAVVSELEGREVGAGGDRQLAGVDGGQGAVRRGGFRSGSLSGRSLGRSGLRSGGSGRSGAAAAGGHAEAQAKSQQNRKILFHRNHSSK